MLCHELLDVLDFLDRHLSGAVVNAGHRWLGITPGDVDELIMFDSGCTSMIDFRVLELSLHRGLLLSKIVSVRRNACADDNTGGEQIDSGPSSAFHPAQLGQHYKLCR